jgi:hypothetical protein
VVRFVNGPGPQMPLKGQPHEPAGRRAGVSSSPPEQHSSTQPRAPAPAADLQDAREDVRDRALRTLEDLLRSDRRVVDSLFPEAFGMASMPSMLPYRRTRDFWEPALSVSTKDAR